MRVAEGADEARDGPDDENERARPGRRRSQISAVATTRAISANFKANPRAGRLTMPATIGFISRATTSADTRSRSWATVNATTSHPSETVLARAKRLSANRGHWPGHLDRCRQRFAAHAGEQVRGGHRGHLAASRPRRRRDVRHDQAVVEPDERVVHRDRLGVGDVERGRRRSPRPARPSPAQPGRRPDRATC